MKKELRSIHSRSLIIGRNIKVVRQIYKLADRLDAQYISIGLMPYYMHAGSWNGSAGCSEEEVKLFRVGKRVEEVKLPTYEESCCAWDSSARWDAPYFDPNEAHKFGKGIYLLFHSEFKSWDDEDVELKEAYVFQI